MFLFDHADTIKGERLDFWTDWKPFGALMGSTWTKTTQRIHLRFSRGLEMDLIRWCKTDFQLCHMNPASIVIGFNRNKTDLPMLDPGFSSNPERSIRNSEHFKH